MIFRVDTAARTLTIENPSMVFGEVIESQLEFNRDGVAYRLPSGTAIGLGIKEWDSQDGTLLAENGTVTRPAADRQPYVFDLDLNTAALQAVFTENVTGLDCGLELKWEVEAGSGNYSKVKTKFRMEAGTHRDTDE